MTKTVAMRSAAAAMTALAFTWIGAEVEAQENYYAGKDVEFIVPYAPGGGNDTFARLLQSQYRACMPEAASIQVVNIPRSEEHTSELQSLMRISYAVFCLKKKNTTRDTTHHQ